MALDTRARTPLYFYGSNSFFLSTLTYNELEHNYKYESQ